MRKALLLLVVFVFAPPTAAAQPSSGALAKPAARPTLPTLVMVRRRPPLPPPALMIKEKKRWRQLQIAKVDIRATIVGHLAETAITMTFYNPNNRVMSGDLYFPLPQGATVSGYALDIQGVLVDGVVVSKDKARQVFEIEVRRGVDPGLVEWTKGQNFKTRVFPIPAKGSRTVRVSYVSEVLDLAEGAMYHLPLAFRDKVKQLSIHVEAVKAVAKPVIASGGPKGMGFTNWHDSFVAKATLQNAKLTNDLYVRLPQLKTKPVQVEVAPDGAVYFSIRDQVPPPPVTRASKTPRRVAVYWDASLSREKVDHRREIALLKTYLNRFRSSPIDVYLVVFRDVAQRPRRFVLPRQAAAFRNAIRDIDYDGGTQLGAVKTPAGMPRTDLSLIFSDGISNYGAELPRRLSGPVYTVNNSSSANHAALKYIALRSGGAYFNLRNISPGAAAKSIGSSVYSFISARATNAKLEDLYPKLPVAVHGSFDLAGKLTGAEAKVTLRYGYPGKITHTKTFVVKRSSAAKGDLLQRYWAQKKLDDLIVFPEKNEKVITQLGRDYSIVTPGTSLIVLERLSQYVEHAIRPPAGLAKMRASYDKTMSTRALQKKRAEKSKLDQVLALWKIRVNWWNKRFKIPKPKPKPKKSKKGLIAHGSGSGSGYGVGAGRGGMRGRAVRPARIRVGNASASRGRRFSSRVSGLGDKSGSKNAEAPAPAPTIQMKAWDPKTPYLAAIKAAPLRKRYSVYLEQRVKYRASPAFYLDCSNYFRKIKRNVLSLRILSNLAELELENPALLRVLAHRLAQVGQLDRSIQSFQRVKKLRPEEPQSFRDLALVHERRGDKRRFRRKAAANDYRRSLALLSKVVMNKWDRFAEIEVIALTELNALLAKARRFGVTKAPIDPRLVKHLHMDIRIVMSWDADSTDMDLHIIEPTGEEAYYSHNKTKIGGIVSRDFTQGYGPEIYTIRRAMRGKYKIKTKFFGSSAAKLIGAVTLQVDVYTNYGRPNQRRKSITLRLTKKKEDFTVGTISF